MPPRQNDLPLIFKAIAFAAAKHRDQRRKDAQATPYINHPIAVAEVLVNAGIHDPEAICAAILHDTIEDTKTSPGELETLFGPRITSIVQEVTDDKNLEKAERKRRQVEKSADASRTARLVKLADKICNLRDINSSPPAGWPLARKQEYFDWAKQVVDRIRGVNADLERLFDQEYTRRP